MSVRQDILDAIKTTLEATAGTGYDLDIKQVSLFHENVLINEDWKQPLVMVLDGGQEQLLVYDGTNYRYEWKIVLYGYVATPVSSTVPETLNNMVATLKKYINSGPSLGSNVLAFKFDNIEETRFDADHPRADVVLNCRCIYWCLAGTF